MNEPSPGFPAPEDLARALREDNRAARKQFEDTLRPLLLKLFERLTRDFVLAYPPEYLLTRALRLAEVFVRSRPVGTFLPPSWKAFYTAAVLHVASVLDQPLKQPGSAGDRDSLALPNCKNYQSQVYFRPYDRVGKSLFGGDWICGQHDDEGSLWLLMADITGHGFTAYLLARALPLIWQMAWQRAGRATQPIDILTSMHHQLESVLPEGIYVEATLLKLTREGEIFLQAAGGTRLILRREGAAQLEFLRYRGCWLGLMPPASKDLHRLRLGHGDELAVATDGLFDQIDGLRGQDLSTLISTAAPSPLMDWLQGLVQESLEAGPQKDDITLLLLQRRPNTVSPLGGSSSRAADVSV